MPKISHLAERRAIIDTCRKMNTVGINQVTAGNVSQRQADGFVITASSFPYYMMKPEEIVEVACDGIYVGLQSFSDRSAG